MKKTAIALLSVVSIFCVPANAANEECAPGYQLMVDQKNNYYCMPEFQDDVSEKDDGRPQVCESRDVESIYMTRNACDQAYSIAANSCSEEKLNEAMKKVNQQALDFEKKIKEGLKKGTPEFRETCKSLTALQSITAARLERLRSQCQPVRTDCTAQCALSSQHLEQQSEAAPNCVAKIQQNLQAVTDNYNACSRFEVVESKLTKAAQQMTYAKEKTAICATSGAAGDKEGPKNGLADGAGDGGAQAKAAEVGTGTDGGDAATTPKVGGDGNPPADQAAVTPPADDSGSDNAEDKQQAKKSNKPNQNEMGSLMGAASSLLSAFMQKSDPQQVEPVQLDASDCRRPENMSSTVCRCQRNWTPDCNGTSASSESFSSNALPGVGGAQMNKENNGSQFSMDPEQPSFEVPRGRGDSGGGGGASYAGGGGGFSPPPANFIPDNNKGRGGSGLSANILNGTYGGGMMGLGSRGAMRPVMRPTRGKSDPEELPGYNLGKKDDRPDFNSFLPPGAGSGGSQIPSRGISGMTGSNLQEGMHPASTDIFKAVSNRYRQLEFTLFADK